MSDHITDMTDLLGKELQVGDRVVWASFGTYGKGMRVGTAEGLGPKGVFVKPKEGTDGRSMWVPTKRVVKVHHE